MSRGGRRRKARRRIQPGKTRRPAGTQAERSKADDRREGKPGQASADASVEEQMRSRPPDLRSPPPDDLVLEDLIAGLQGEYGIPPAPQEYRLLIRTPSSEAEAAEPGSETAESADETPTRPDSAPAIVGRRRRRRRSSAGSGASGTEPAEAASGDEPVGEPNPDQPSN